MHLAYSIIKQNKNQKYVKKVTYLDQAFKKPGSLAKQASLEEVMNR